MRAEEARIRVVANGWVDQGDGTLELTALGEVRILERLSDGRVATVYRADLRGSPVALKIFKPRSIRRHAGRNPFNIAEFEYRRNRAFYEAPGLVRYVARPIGFFHTPGVAAVVQELLRGELYYDYHRTGGAEDPARIEALFAHIRRIVELAHESDLFDLDLHALNVMVVQERGEPIPKLFDFNRIPFYEHPRNPLEALLLRTRLLDLGSRDRRKLRQFHDFRHLESRLNRS
jgi:serine/threonine protein kinase